jgi:hypothetical protein
MKILLVAMANSIHTARWIDQIADQGWDLHLFPSTDSGIEVHRDLRNVRLHPTMWLNPARNANGVRFHGISLARRVEDTWRRRVRREKGGPDADRLARVLDRLDPDIVHTMEIQHAGYLALEAKRRLAGRSPPGSSRTGQRHLPVREAGRARAEDPQGPRVVRLLIPANAGASSRWPGPSASPARCFPCSERGRLRPGNDGLPEEPGALLLAPGIMLKGYQHWGGRALTGLRALERCADLLGEYEVWIYSASPDVAVAAELFGARRGSG